MSDLLATVGAELAPFQPSQRYFLLDVSHNAGLDPSGPEHENLVSALVRLESGRSPGEMLAALDALRRRLSGPGDENLKRALRERARQVELPDEVMARVRDVTGRRESGFGRRERSYANSGQSNLAAEIRESGAGGEVSQQSGVERHRGRDRVRYTRAPNWGNSRRGTPCAIQHDGCRDANVSALLYRGLRRAVSTSGARAVPQHRELRRRVTESAYRLISGPPGRRPGRNHQRAGP